MLDLFIRALARLLTPLFLAGLIGSAFVVLSKIGSDIVEFFEDDPQGEANDNPS